MTGERNGGASPVYGLYGDFYDRAESVEELLVSGIVLRQIPVDVLIALETGAQTLQREALKRVAGLATGDFIGAAGFDDWWNKALRFLNRDFPLAAARELVIDKAAMYARLRDQGLNVARFMSGQLSAAFLSEAVRTLGPQPIIKPTTGAGSRGVYRYRTDLSAEENLSLYQGILKRGNIDSSTSVVAAEYLDSPEVSVEVLIAAGSVVHVTVHEKRTATDIHPFVDLVMVSPPLDPRIRESEPALQQAVSQLASALEIHDGVLHAELRLHQQRWCVLDVGVRPGAGLVSHSVRALSGTDLQLMQLRACLGLPISPAPAIASRAQHAATCIACCYLADLARPAMTLGALVPLASELDKADDVFGWHLNAAEIRNDSLYMPDAGLSVGIGANDADAALDKLHALVSRYHFSTGPSHRPGS
jgi:ATP-grasp domain